MKLCLVLGIFALLSIGSVFSSNVEDEVSYEGYKLVSVSLKSQQDVNVIQELEANPDVKKIINVQINTKFNSIGSFLLLFV